MSEQIRDDLGNVVGDTTMFSKPNDGTRNISFERTGVKPYSGGYGREDRKSGPNNYDTTDKPWDLNSERLKSVQYPLNGDGRHSIKFYINISEESKLIKKGQVVFVSSDPTERGKQNRPDANPGEIKSISNLVALGAGATGASFTGAALMKLIKGGVVLSKPALYGLTAYGGVAAAAGVGAATEYGVGEYLKLSNSLKRLHSTITLYSPANIKSDYSFNYDTDRNVIADLMTQEGSNNIIQGLESLGGAASAIPRIVAVAANSTIGLLSKTAINPKQTMMFKEVAPRTFSFEYRFAPKSKEEAAEVASIIRTFKIYSHPEMIEGYGNFLYIYPAEFDIEYHFIDESGRDVVNKNLNKISSCYLERIDLNFSAGGSFQSLASGEPIVTDMVLVFREIERLHRDRIIEGY